MATIKINRTPKISVIPSARDLANADTFDKVAASLGVTEEKTRPRRWLLLIGALLQRMRSQADLKQETMAKTAGVTQAYLSRLENGRIPKRGPTVEVLLRCADAANCDIEITLRSRKDHQLIGAISSQNLNEEAENEGPVPFDWKPLQEQLAREPAEGLKVIFETSPARRAPHRAMSENPLYLHDIAGSTAKIEQAKATLAEILRAFDAYLPKVRHSSRLGAKVKPVDLGPLSARAASELVQALEVVWPLRNRLSHAASSHHAQPTSPVTVGAGDLVVIGGNDLSAETGSVRVLGAAAEFVKATESEA
jgi:transcriptional regulator with XRE-family HTH domain